jgi:hypothetical protein
VALRHGHDQLVLDIGPLCPPHLPPHAHADALSFVLWLDGAPVVIDPGTGGYEPPALRAWARATATHSTVAVDGRDQCVFWGPFRASRLPDVRRGPLEIRPDAVVLTARHDGYRRLADPVEHVRTFCWLPGDGVVVVDRLHGRSPSGLSRLPLAAGMASRVRITTLDGSKPSEHEGVTAPFFGVTSRAPVLEQRLGAGPTGWVITRSDATVAVEGADVEVRRPGLDPVRFRAP